MNKRKISHDQKVTYVGSILKQIEQNICWIIWCITTFPIVISHFLKLTRFLCLFVKFLNIFQFYAIEFSLMIQICYWDHTKILHSNSLVELLKLRDCTNYRASNTIVTLIGQLNFFLFTKVCTCTRQYIDTLFMTFNLFNIS